MQSKEIPPEEMKHWPLGGYIGVISTVIAIFLVIPLFTKSFYAHVVLQGFFTLLILSIMTMVNGHRGLLYLGSILVALFLIFDTLSIYLDSLSWMLGAYSCYSLFLVLGIYCIAKRVLSTRFSDTNVIFGAITVYFLVGILWSKVYFIEDSLLPNSFHGIVSLDLNRDGISEGYQNQFDFLYYSFTVLTTLGLGDISPLHRLAKSLTMMEAMFGQLFVATAIAKLVTVWRKRL